jgi:hypothetical protein
MEAQTYRGEIIRLPRGCLKKISKRQYSTLILMVFLCFVLKEVSVASSQTSRSAAWHHETSFHSPTDIEPLSLYVGETAVDAQCLAPSDDLRHRDPGGDVAGRDF